MRFHEFVLALLLAATSLPAQTVIDGPEGRMQVVVRPKAAPKPPPDARRIPSLISALTDDKAWWDAAKELARFEGTEHEDAVFEELGELWRSTDDKTVHERFHVVFGKLARPSHLRARRAETEKLVDDVKHFLDQLESSIGRARSTEDVATLAAQAKTVSTKLEKLRKDLKLMDEAELQKAKGSEPSEHLPPESESEGGPFESGVPGTEPPARESKTANPPGGTKPAPPAGGSGEPAPVPPAHSAGDLRRIFWIRPVDEAAAAARAAGRVLLVKPIMGGSNTPDPEGVPCGGARDCEGSW